MTEALASAAFLPEPLPLCAHCGLPLARSGRSEGPLYCCSGCALAHRITGGEAGHGRATGLLMAVGIGAFLAINVMMLSLILYTGTAEADRLAGEAWVRWALLLLATPAVILLGGPFLARGLFRLGRLRLDADVLIAVGVLAAYVHSARSVIRGEGHLYLDTAMGILLFVTLGRYLEASARARTTDALAGLERQMPEVARRLGADGAEEAVPVAALVAGDRVRVRPGERLPADGVVAVGEASVSQAEITGEPLPLAAAPGTRVAAGTLCLDGSLVIEVERSGGETTLARLVRLVEQARGGGYPLAPLVDRFAAAFVPGVLVLAAGTFAWWALAADTGTALMCTLSVLLIACPCTIGIAVPLAVTVASGRAARAGVLVRSGQVFERLAKSRRVFFDKTGTLTRGELVLEKVEPAPGVTAEQLLAVAAALEEGSEHPIARAVRAAAGIPGLPCHGFRALPGRGVVGIVEIGGVRVEARLGTAEHTGAEARGEAPAATVVHLSVGGRPWGGLVLSDEIRPESAPAVAALANRGLTIEVLSGDHPAAVAALGRRLPGVRAEGGLSPEAKLARVAASVAAGEHPVMVGDGVNDAPALSGSAVAVTLESGTDLAREVAEVTILGGDLSRLPWLVDLARRTLQTARRSLIWALAYNGIGLALAVAGKLHPVFGAVAMVTSSLLVVLRSQRLARVKLPGGAW
ncbi:MAG TPA: cation-translocating P-type ATPase [Thermoanaerobaculia bacterium]|nr:cation-translocating P-type ATPase [Thermoanaerobaculia bacterium]